MKTVAANVASLESSVAHISSKVDRVYAAMKQSKHNPMLSPNVASSGSSSQSDTDSCVKQENGECSKYISVCSTILPAKYCSVIPSLGVYHLRQYA